MKQLIRAGVVLLTAMVLFTGAMPTRAQAVTVCMSVEQWTSLLGTRTATMSRSVDGEEDLVITLLGSGSETFTSAIWQGSQLCLNVEEAADLFEFVFGQEAAPCIVASQDAQTDGTHVEIGAPDLLHGNERAMSLVFDQNLIAQLQEQFPLLNAVRFTIHLQDERGEWVFTDLTFTGMENINDSVFELDYVAGGFWIYYLDTVPVSADVEVQGTWLRDVPVVNIQ